LETISTDSWQLTLPGDWIATNSGEGGEYAFESGDGAKGIHVATWLLGPGALRTASDLARAFRATNLSSLEAMPGYAWQILVDEVVELGPLHIVLSDAWAREQSYRIAGVILTRGPLVVRAAFHDYLCEDMEASRAYFAPIVESLQLVELR
jgi:hypothetical protein